ncbi:hypothetical protein [Nonomuraea longicatena]
MMDRVGDLLTKAVLATALACAPVLLAAPALAAAPEERLFTMDDPRITESSGLAVSPGHKGIYYTHNDSSAAPEFFAVDSRGRTKAVFRIQNAQARDWEAMAASTDPQTGRGVLWFADIGDNLDGAWPDISVYKVTEPTTLRDGVVRAVRYRFKYSVGGRNAEGIMVDPRTGRLFVVSKEFAGAVYAAPRKLRTGRVNILRKVAEAPIMATDAAYAPDGQSYVVRTYFSATIFRPGGEMITKVAMPQLKQAESITFTPDGTSLLVGSEGVNSPVYRVPVPARALSKPTASPKPAASASRVSDTAEAGRGLTAQDVLIWLGAAAGATGVIAFIARRSR